MTLDENTEFFSESWVQAASARKQQGNYEGKEQFACMFVAGS